MEALRFGQKSGVRGGRKRMSVHKNVFLRVLKVGEIMKWGNCLAGIQKVCV
jgi:hypothetical protein